MSLFNLRLGIRSTPEGDLEWLRLRGYEGAANDMIYEYLFDIGYTIGAINDRLRAYTVANRILYGIEGLEPVFVADTGSGNYYITLFNTSTVNTLEPVLLFDCVNDNIGIDTYNV